MNNEDEFQLLSDRIKSTLEIRPIKGQFPFSG